ncbi:histidine kinase [Bifidobacterium sp. SO4]|uniref:histidine kinase dimerization/phosphoacceptor domain-containing protein n=1 Tax=Bifidobacterium sp. SO4 TaxID=2809030 RepID=UPI001BDCDF10|nr:histidine kinase [Bifidobacterium sp. SO4]MBT1170536.1 hypothetical protein [Bifidobacterium sp. SO4]
MMRNTGDAGDARSLMRRSARHVLDWWREPHFLEKTGIVVDVVQVVAMVAVPPSGPMQMLCALVWLVLVAALPFAPRVLCVAGPVLCLIAGALPNWSVWTTGGVALTAWFLAIGYVMPRWAAVALPVGFSVLDAAGCAWFGFGSLGGIVIRSVVASLNDINWQASTEAGVMVPADASVALPQYPIIIFVATLMLDLMILGFLTVCSAAFRRTAAAGERAARAEQLLGRVTREQELAHMIHDSVANDMSTIAMLSWRAKGVENAEELDELLDAIYARSHHALDRVHEVIDVLNGKRDLGELRASGSVDDVDAAPQVSRDSFDVIVEKYVEDQDRAMGMLGFAGVSRLNIMPDAQVPEPVRRATMGLLEEVYANIVRHCAMSVAAGEPDGGAETSAGSGAEAGDEPAYSLFIDISRDCVAVSEVNALADERRTLVHGHGRGDGLALQRTTIESLGGTLNTSHQDGTWILSARIPLR